MLTPPFTQHALGLVATRGSVCGLHVAFFIILGSLTLAPAQALFCLTRLSCEGGIIRRREQTKWLFQVLWFHKTVPDCKSNLLIGQKESGDSISSLL
ncbi:hypothetical protein SKAU_G00013010 [Synaphobranchus kaupii]|uniref:Uncharacterized protein n=1 Tax=Synaphobranchus kaupii TaxID=118154 RepID=A0A9Q1GBJ3_SYNKA|nr:hypothetical protein SKAU_G00013010 [Synaphobranchus kaupii]